MKQPVGDDAYQDLTEPIAVIGTGCRLPGRASTLEGFHDMLMNARRIDSEVPEARFNANKWFHPSNDRKGAVSKQSGFTCWHSIYLDICTGQQYSWVLLGGRCFFV